MRRYITAHILNALKLKMMSFEDFDKIIEYICLEMDRHEREQRLQEMEGQRDG